MEDYRPRPWQATPVRPPERDFRGGFGADIDDQPLRNLSRNIVPRQAQDPWKPLDFHIPANPPWRSWDAQTENLVKRAEDIIRNGPRFQAPPPPPPHVEGHLPPGIPPAPPGEGWGKRRLPQA